MPPDEPTAAAARLDGFEHAAKALRLSSITIVPVKHPGSKSGHAVPNVVELKLYDSYAHNGSLQAIAYFPLAVWRLVRVLRAFRCQCIIASTPAPFVPFQGLLAARILGVPYVLDVRDSWAMESLTHLGSVRNRIKEYIERVSARNASRVWFVTRGLLERLRTDYELNTAVVDFIPNGADLTMFRPVEGPRDIDLVFLGSPARYRNVEGVLLGIAHLKRLMPRVRVIFVGWPGSANERVFTTAISGLGLTPNVELELAVARSKVPFVLSRAKLGIVSFSDDDVYRAAIGAKAYEYIACGVPLACLGPPGDSELRRMVEQHDIGFYSSTPDEFAARAHELLSVINRWILISKKCREASKEFDRRTISERALADHLLPMVAERARAR